MYSNISSATSELLSRQIDDSLVIIEGRLVEASNQGGTLTAADYQSIVAGFGVNDGGVFIVDERGVVIADSQNVMIGLSVAELSWYIDAISTTSSEFEAVYGQTPVYAHGVIIDGMLVVSYMAISSLDDLMTTPLYVIGVVGVICIVVMGFIIYFIVTKLLINPIEALAFQIKGLSRGERIRLKPLKGCPELKVSAKRINRLMALSVSKEEQMELEKEREKEQAKEQFAAPTSAPVPLPAPLSASAPAPAPAQVSTFEFLTMLKEVTGELRGKVVAKKLNFSLKIGKKVPKIIIADREAETQRVRQLFDEVIEAALPNSKVLAEVSLVSPLRPVENAAAADTVPAVFARSLAGNEHAQQANLPEVEAQAEAHEDVVIAFVLNYDSQEKKIFIEAKRG